MTTEENKEASQEVVMFNGQVLDVLKNKVLAATDQGLEITTHNDEMLQYHEEQIELWEQREVNLVKEQADLKEVIRLATDALQTTESTLSNTKTALLTHRAAFEALKRQGVTKAKAQR